MTLDPVHLDGIADLAGRLTGTVDTREHTALAKRAFEEFLDPLYDASGDVVLEPVGEHGRHRVSIADVALAETPFPTQHGLDAGTINPTTFKNGLVLDVSQAAMAADPSDVDLHRARTIVMTVHSNDETLDLGGDWLLDDAGYARRRILHAPRVDRYEQTVVHALALYRAESEHALEQADVVEDVLVLDGPIYPTGLLKWVERDPELKRLVIEEREFTGVVENYLRLVERFVERDVPLLGFVKNSASRALTRELRRAIGAPWVDDEAFFRAVLEPGVTETDSLAFTGWFRSRAGTDGVITSETLDLASERTLATEDYAVTFFVVYDPRDDLVYRVEAPYAVTRDEATRERLRRYVLSEIAAHRGPPLAVSKADDLASIDRAGKRSLRRRIEDALETTQQRSYDERRWGPIAGADVDL